MIFMLTVSIEITRQFKHSLLRFNDELEIYFIVLSMSFYACGSNIHVKNFIQSYKPVNLLKVNFVENRSIN